METAPLKIIRNNKNRYDVTDVSQEVNVEIPIQKFRKWLIQFFIGLEQWGSAAAKAIRK